MRVRIAGAVLFGIVLSTAAAAQPPSPLIISPSSGFFADTQRMDLVILLGDTGGRAIVGAQVLLDNHDITALVVSLFRPEPTASGLSYRSPTLPMGILGRGPHTFEVILALSDGSQLRAGAVWEVMRSN